MSPSNYFNQMPERVNQIFTWMRRADKVGSTDKDADWLEPRLTVYFRVPARAHLKKYKPWIGTTPCLKLPKLLWGRGGRSTDVTFKNFGRPYIVHETLLLVVPTRIFMLQKTLGIKYGFLSLLKPIALWKTLHKIWHNFD